MKAKIVAWALNFVLSYVKSHPEAVDKILDSVAKRIPGKVDDAAIALLKKALSV